MVVQKAGEVYLYSFSNLGAKLGWLVNATPLQIYVLEIDSILIVQEAGWGPEPVWTCVDHLRPQVFDPLTVQVVQYQYIQEYVCVYLCMCREAICCRYMNCSIESSVLAN